MQGKYNVLGVQSNKGNYEGNDFDYTKLLVVMPMPSSDRVKGYDVSKLKFGDSSNFAKFAGVNFPCELDLDMSTVSTGNGVLFTINSFKPVVKV